ncbi:HlyC/CorC family transporter [Natronomonas salina]|uniref:hemolysin family protein n=1 Tax=Natronomonas salina TaxID=1710540 RepID=UPI0015B6B04A|nr:hemolysin family protein [Natronomonas salina]QLD88099.1 HlyC/CorC family transporter [Natronomonas salina]
MTATSIGMVGIDAGSTALVATLGVGALLVLLVLSAFFSSAEIAMFSLPRHRIEALAEEGVDGAETVEALKSDPHRLLVTILVGNNLVNIAMSSLATALLAMYLARGQAVLAATFGVTAVILLFGESAPKSYAIEHTESWALTVARPLRLSGYVLLPLVATFDRLTRLVNRVTGGGSAVGDPYVTREEIREVIQTGESEGVIDSVEQQLLRRVLRFEATIAKELMTPRLDVTAVPRTATVEETVSTCVDSGHTRLPTYDGDLDTIVGVIELGDIANAPAGDRIDRFVAETLTVPESKPADELFREMRRRRIEQVVVVDEFGTIEGLVTTEDIVETIVGEILDARESESLEVVDERTVRVDGTVNVESVNEVLDVDLPEGEAYETVAGFIFDRSGRLVSAGETFAYEGHELTVEAVDTTRIERVEITNTGATNSQSTSSLDTDESSVTVS